MLLANASRWPQFPVSLLCGAVASQRAMWGRHETLNVATDASSAIPAGNLAPSAFRLPRVSGGMAVVSEGAGGATGILIPTYPMLADIIGSGDLDALAALAVSMLANVTGDGSLSATVTGLQDAVAALTGSGDLDAGVNGLAAMLADLAGAGDLDAVIAAHGEMYVDIVVTGAGITTASIAQAVWTYINGSDETGEQLLKALKAAKLAAALSA